MDKEFIFKKYQKIIPEKFSLTLTENRYIKSFKEDNDLIYDLFLGSIDDMKLTNISTSLVFKKIEQIINPNFILGYNNPTIKIDTNRFLFKTSIGKNTLSLLPISIATKEGVTQACELIKQYIEQDAMPFFNHWRDIRDFLPYLEIDDINFLADLFCGDAFYKKAIIWKLCSHPKYRELTEKMIESFKQELIEGPNDNLLKKDYAHYFKILNTLEKTEPMYEWNEKYLVAKPFK